MNLLNVNNENEEKPKRLYCKNCGRWTWNRYSDGVLEPREKAHLPNVANYCEDCFGKSNK
ncbi:hypothetical protein FDC27_08950 [Clostridium botulinum]|nr:hypothetical protein [Clostridium botulinum]NFO67086.1 hypothetical protein [Clostridium botulinum]